MKGDLRMKPRVIERLIQLNKPFMLLMPTHFLQTKTFKNFRDAYGKFQFLIPTQKVKFYHLDKNGEDIFKYGQREIPLFYCMWYCWNMNYKRDFELLG